MEGFAGGATRAAMIAAAGVVAGLCFNAWRVDGIELGRPYFLEQEERRELLSEGFVVIGTDRAADLFAEAAEYPGFVVFIDARSRELFRAGHVRGAVHLDYYRLHDEVAGVRPAVDAAERVVVYCDSAECDDALLLCRALRDTYAVPAEKLLLYLDGLRGWQDRDLPVERDER